MADANTTPVTATSVSIKTAGDLIVTAEKVVVDKVSHLSWFTRVISAFGIIRAKVQSVLAWLKTLSREKVIMAAGILTALLLGLVVWSHLATHSPESKSSSATNKIEGTMMSSRSIKILDGQAMALVNDFRSGKSMLPLERSGWLDDEAVRIAQEMTALKADVKANPLVMSEQVAARFSEATRVLAVGQATFEDVVNAWLKDQKLAAILSSGRYDMAGLAYVEDTKSHWKHHWVIVLAKSKTERS